MRASPVHHIILDRDGVINRDSDQFIKTPDEWQPIEGSLEAIARLKQAGFIVGIASNQSGIGRGLFDQTTLNAMHEKMQHLLAKLGSHVDLIAFCPHTPEDNCDCRKPLPGLYLQLAKRWNIDLNGVPIIGDSLRDLQAAQAVDAYPILVRTGKGEKTLAQLQEQTIPVFKDLSMAVDHLLQEQLVC
ncbi:MAG TPA: D-glycero-beta-D-manno-heptose 1,7-bisphosphate 7-phosphatase [Desulfobacteraceae bacterium]|nr:D-glycero-beta-D-manno-heptose 1,7-bisphosphate 7-phosphatase [Desulfobacteraceae bacterium]